MDNITHSLVGVALADLVSGRRAPKLQRPILTGAAVIAANLPDIDAVYAAITPAPLGYLLHHRGHTHTVVGLIALAAMMAAIYRAMPAVKRLPWRERWRLWGLIAAALASHLLLDALNSYGVHPFFPFDSSWYYGDVVFIFEPWLWLVLMAAAAWNAQSRAGWIMVLVPIALLLVVVASMAIVPVESAVFLIALGAGFAVAMRRLSPRSRASVALIAASSGLFGMYGLSKMARAEAIRALESDRRGTLVDVILTPNPAAPLCWMVIAIELDEPANRYRLSRGTLSLAPRWKAPASCPSDRFMQRGARDALARSGNLVWKERIDQPLDRLRELARNDCWVRAWLRFSRAPVIRRDEAFDLRFADRRNQEFSHLRLSRHSGNRSCPSFVPAWGMPRADLVATR